MNREKKQWVIDVTCKLIDEPETIQVYAWGETIVDAFAIVSRDTKPLNPSKIEPNYHLSEILQDQWEKYNSLPWWKKMFTSMKYPVAEDSPFNKSATFTKPLNS